MLYYIQENSLPKEPAQRGPDRADTMTIEKVTGTSLMMTGVSLMMMCVSLMMTVMAVTDPFRG